MKYPVWVLITLFVVLSAIKLEITHAQVAPMGPTKGVEGTLLANVEDHLADQHIEKCDIENKAIILELAAVIDAKQTEFQKYTTSSLQTSDGRAVQVGPAQFRETKPILQMKKGWITNPTSWKASYDLYLKIKNQPTSTDWLTLNTNVHFLVANDRSRIKFRQTMGLDLDSGPKLKKLVNTLRERIEAKDDELHLGVGATEFALKISNYKEYILLISTEKDPNQRRDLIRRFYELAQFNNSAFEFKKNHKMRRVSSRIFEVTIDPGPFEGHETWLTEKLEWIWHSDDYSVKIVWKKDPEAFKMLFDPGFGQASVYFGTKSMQLYSGTADKVLAHEFGHVLGLMDHYYNVWNSETCVYTYKLNQEDIMSHPLMGEVTKDDWNELAKAYPYSH